MSYDDNAIQALSDAILTSIDTKITTAPFDKTLEGRIIAPLDSNFYTVLVNGYEYSAIAYGGNVYNVNEFVKITIPQNNYNKMYIEPKGATYVASGYTGSQGYTGSKGDIGYIGSKGDTGYTGSASTVIGYTGSASTVIGYTGSLGYVGSKGYTGSIGYTGSLGYTGSIGIGYTGSQGIIGYTGSIGIIGYTGSKGYTGSTGYTGSASTVIGYTGSQGYTGSVGYIGSKGYSGSQGYIGSQGYTGSQGIIGYTGSGASGSGGGYASNIYLTNTDSTIYASYKQLSYLNDTSPTEHSYTVSSATEVLYSTYLFDEQLETTIIDAGNWSISFYCKLSTYAGSPQIKAEVFKRNISGIETTLFSEYTQVISNIIYDRIRIDTIQPLITLLSTDRLGVRFYIKSTVSASITFYNMIGGTQPTYTNTPLALRHTQLRGLNDDVNNVHITTDEKTLITHINRTSLDLVSGTNTGDQNINTLITPIYTTTTAVTEGYYRIATIPIGTQYKQCTFRIKGYTAIGTTTESTIDINLAYYSGSYSSQYIGIFANTSHSYNSSTNAENGIVLLYCRVSFDATYAYIDMYKYKTTTVTMETQPLIINDWVWATGLLTVNPTIGSYKNSSMTLNAGQSGNNLSANYATYSSYSNYGVLGGYTLNNTSNKTGLWEYIGNIYIPYSSTYLLGNSNNISIRVQELSPNGSISANNLDDFHLNIQSNLSTHTDANTFNALVPDININIVGSTKLNGSDIAALTYSTSTSAKYIRIYIKLSGNNTFYTISPEERYGYSFSTTSLNTMSYFTIASAQAVLASLPTPALGSIVYGNVITTTGYTGSKGDVGYVGSQGTTIKGTGTIPITGWSASTGDYAYYINIDLLGIINSDVVSIYIDKDYLDIANNSQIASTTESYTSGITIFANIIPTSPIPFTWTNIVTGTTIITGYTGSQGYTGSNGLIGYTGSQGGGMSDIVQDLTPQLGGELDQNSHTIGGVEYDNGNSGTSKAINWTLGNHQKVTMNGNCTFTFTAPTRSCALSLRFINDSTAGRTITLPTIKTSNGTALSWSSTANAIDILNLYYDGTSYYGMNTLNFI